MFQKYIKSLSKDFSQILEPLTGKPALLSALVLTATLASIDAPNFAWMLMFPVALASSVSSSYIQRIIFASIVIGISCHLLMANKPLPAKVPAEGCGIVESTQQRASGQALIISAKTPGQFKVRITEKRELPLYPLPGDSICYEASWYPVTPPTVPGAFDTRGWLTSQHLAAYGKFKHWTVYSHRWIPERSFYAFRNWIRSRFSRYLDNAETGLLLGLLAGDRTGIPDVLRSDFQRSGLVHVLAISGFHVVLLAGILMVLLKATGLPHRLAKIIAVLLLLIYIPVTGGSPAVRRAVLMFSVPQIGSLFQRPANTLNSLGVALLIIILPEPSVIWNPGFQLSVAATAGIILSTPLNPLKKIPAKFSKNRCFAFIQGFILEPTYVTLCATLATAPFLVHHFKTLSPLAWLGNIVVVPAISMGMQAGLFALLSPFSFLQEHFCYAAKFFLRLASLLTRFLSDSSQAAVTVGPFGPSILLLVGFFILLTPLLNKNRLAKRYALLCLLFFSFTYFYTGYKQILFPSWKLTTIDIGQGDSHLITTPSQKHILVDAGDNSRQDSGKDIIIPFLRYSGISKIDALIITHPDLDHYGGALSIVKTFPVKELWITDCARSETKDSWQQVLSTASRKGISIRNIERGFLWKEDFFELKVIHPTTQQCTDANTQSITFRAKGLGHSAVLTGDLTIAGEKEILKTDVYLKSDILKLGHHGSKTSSGRDFLNAVQPRLALISSGRHNRFKHPSKQVIQRLDSLNIPYVNTAEKGTITITFTEDTLLVNTMLK